MVSSVLLVDDDPAFLMLAARILEGMDIEVVATAEGVMAAIAAANATRPEAALVDVGLPDGDGIELAYQLAQMPWRPRVVVTSTDRDAGCAIEPQDGDPKLPFVPKEELADSSLRGLLGFP
jgi:CheY-like chemotaxis protein